MKEKILESLKTKYKHLGLGQKVLEGFATRLAKTITEEDQIEKAVDDVEPELQTWQSLIDSHRREISELKRVIDSLKPKGGEVSEAKPEATPEKPSNDESKDVGVPSWAEALMNEIKSLKQDKIINSRKAAYESLFKEVKDERIKQRELANFDRLQFKDDEDFNSFLEAQKEFVKELVQAQAAEELKSPRPFMSQPSTGKVSEKEVEAIVENLPI